MRTTDIGLGLDGVAQRFFDRAGGFPCRCFRGVGDVEGAVAGLAINVPGGVLHLAGNVGGLLPGIAESAVEIGVLGTGLWHSELPKKRLPRDNARAAQKFGNRNDYGVAGVVRTANSANEDRAVDEPKRQQPEIPTPPPMTEPKRSPPETPDIHAPEKNSPATGES
jgi:hypothetical protein